MKSVHRFYQYEKQMRCFTHDFKRVVIDTEYATIKYDYCKACGRTENFVLIGKRKATEGVTVKW